MIHHLYLHHFRSYSEASFSFQPGINLFLGKNGQGKTNLLEALSLLCLGRSFRTDSLSDLIEKGAPFFFVEAQIEIEKRSLLIQLSFDGHTKKASLDGASFPHFSSLLGHLPLIVSSPEDLQLFQASPSIRRRFLNLYLSQNHPLYVHHLSRYTRAMKQRNALLQYSSMASLEEWEVQMGESAQFLQKTREEFLATIPPLLEKYHTSFVPEEETFRIALHQNYPKDLPTYCKTLFLSRKKDQALHYTFYGPHRDDLLFTIEGKTAKTFGSEGQKKSALLALQLALWERLTTTSPALFAIDDFGAHLDTERNSLLLQTLQRAPQSFLTSVMPPPQNLSMHILSIERKRPLPEETTPPASSLFSPEIAPASSPPTPSRAALPLGQTN